MKSQLRTLAKYRDAELAKPMTDLLHRRGIPFELEDASVAFDITFSNNAHFKEFHLKVPETYYQKALKIWEADSEELMNEVDEHHYLFDFSDEELWEILAKSDEWSKEDFVLAKKILADRGITVTKKELEKLEASRLEELSKPSSADPAWIFIGYLLSLMGGIAGIFIGYNYGFQKTLPDGSRVHAYDEASRKHGKAIFYLGIAVFVLVNIAVGFAFLTYR